MTDAPAILVVGDLVADVRIAPTEPPAPGEEVAGDVTLHGGGSAANQAAWLASLGARVRFAGRVGDDALGALLTDELVAAGVDARVARDATRPTGIVAALIGDGGERALVTGRAANVRLAPSDVPAALWDDAAVLVLTGYCFTHPDVAATGRALVDEARRRALPFVVDPASARLFSVHPGARAFLEWTSGAAWCLPSAAEARALTGASSAEDAARALLSSYEGVAVTDGARGCVVATRAASRAERVAVPAVVDALDTTGAGDAFAAGFVHAWTTGAGPRDAARAGHAAAARALAVPGARPPGPRP
ncbi:MAG TPA: PfkB family carbohydrate kinase [Actinomycetota bacterium]|nr:PfkB family carbohydrate kinase [Actinomycetota bacterium]